MSTATRSRSRSRSRSAAASRRSTRPTEPTIDWRPADLAKLTAWCEDRLRYDAYGIMEFIPFRNKRTGRIGVATLIGGREFHDELDKATPLAVVAAVVDILRRIKESIQASGAAGYDEEEDDDDEGDE